LARKLVALDKGFAQSLFFILVRGKKANEVNEKSSQTRSK
jgi:hypothetical protein